MKRIVMIIAIVLALVALIAPLIGCFGSGEAEETLYQLVTVQRGDLTIDITAAGNLTLSLEKDLAFEISGTVEEVLVEEGDSVEEGQVLARLDASEVEAERTALEVALLQAQMDLEAAEDDVLDIEYTLQLALLNAEINVKTAYKNLFEAEDTVVGYDSRDVDIQDLRLDKAKMERDKAKQNLAEMDKEVAKAEVQVRLAELRLEDAQRELDEALDAGPEITAPFDGFITRVNVEGGDEVLKGTVAVTIASPDEFEADILVSEMDILQIELGGEAYVQVDAMSGLSLPAEVTHISPTATIQSGVVNYEVKVEVASLEEMIQQQQEAQQEAMENIEQGELPERLKQAIEAGQITQEQAEEMMKQMQQGQVSTSISEDFQLREGLTVTVSIIVEEREDVLLVSNEAIITRGGQTYVQVPLADGTIEERAITVGISDWQYTEVTNGLSEGEQVVVPQGTTTTTTTPQQEGPPRGMIIPGMGRPR